MSGKSYLKKFLILSIVFSIANGIERIEASIPAAALANVGLTGSNHSPNLGAILVSQKLPIAGTAVFSNQFSNIGPKPAIVSTPNTPAPILAKVFNHPSRSLSILNKLKNPSLTVPTKSPTLSDVDCNNAVALSPADK